MVQLDEKGVKFYCESTDLSDKKSYVKRGYFYNFPLCNYGKRVNP